MFNTLFGADMPLAVRFFLAFLIVLGLIGITAWAVRRFGAGRLGGGSTRGRQPRLAVIDYASVDGRRRLILVRRDNVEHLLMIGGPTDVVVEPNIVRAVAASRDAPGTRPPVGIEALSRAIPLPDASNGGSWPLQPEPASAMRPAPLPDELPRSLTEPPRPPRDTLSALADELSPRSTPPRSRSAAPRPQAEEPAEELRPEPRLEPRKPIAPPVTPQPTTPPAPPIAPAASAGEATPDQSLAEMAQRLESALRKPGEARQAAPTRATPASEQPATPTAPRAPRPAETKPRPDAKPGANKGTLYDSLEQEMASLLGRSNKT